MVLGFRIYGGHGSKGLTFWVQGLPGRSKYVECWHVQLRWGFRPLFCLLLGAGFVESGVASGLGVVEAHLFSDLG